MAGPPCTLATKKDRAIPDTTLLYMVQYPHTVLLSATTQRVHLIVSKDIPMTPSTPCVTSVSKCTLPFVVVPRWLTGPDMIHYNRVTVKLY